MDQQSISDYRELVNDQVAPGKYATPEDAYSAELLENWFYGSGNGHMIEAIHKERWPDCN